MPYKDPEKRKEVKRRYDQKRAGRTRNFATVVYPDSAPENWKEILAETYVSALISPFHDQDVNPDGTQKKPHYHVLVMFENVKTKQQALDFFAAIGGVGLENIGSLRGYARYLCHLDNPEKHQYDPSDVVEVGGADYFSLTALPSDKYQAIGEMVDWCESVGCMSYRELFLYARVNRQDWFRALCDNCTMVMKEYLKSSFWDAQRPERPLDNKPYPQSPKNAPEGK